jgi:hypothetical protein
MTNKANCAQIEKRQRQLFEIVVAGFLGVGTGIALSLII